MKNIFRPARCGEFLLAASCLCAAGVSLHAQWVQTSGPYGGVVSALAVSPKGAGGTNLFAGTPGGGVWRRPLSEMITSVPAEDRSTDLPTQFSLAQNYPNPFNPATTIEFSLPHAGLVRLVVCDVLGREVAVLVSARLSAGRHKVEWDAGAVPAGVYLCRLTTEGLAAVKKMTVLE
ncbi:MAG: T9SS type A sorting domain-containing protein [bacterium]|jgi:hypothetical protein|nr:T9SS type A sorting domain-containing protein [candidate division KSB1 bacterium]MDH7561117.1 T9SS type A sorting domain-containing protein [bacterium]